GDRRRHRRRRDGPRVQGRRDRVLPGSRGAHPHGQRRGHADHLQRPVPGRDGHTGSGRGEDVHRAMSIADGLAVLRALSVIPIWYALALDLRATALGIFALAAISDAVDGWLARRRGSQTLHGAVLDPI